MPKTAVVALGGNAFTREGQAGSPEEQSDNAMNMARTVAAIRKAGWNVVLVHGNGPQIGNLAIQQEEGAVLVPPQPLFALGAMTQGEMGSLISLALRAVAPDVAVIAVVTHVVVAADDPAFASPTKPIGPFFTSTQAAELAADRGWAMIEDSGRGFRRVVASPRPLAVVEAAAIRALIATDSIVIAGGGGGVPVVADGTALRGAEAVIDKDYVASQLATALDADALVLVTSVPRVLLDFGRATERPLTQIDVSEAERHQREGQFPAGSMGPKVDAATQFVRSGGEIAVITTPDLAVDTLGAADEGLRRGRGRAAGFGTRIVATAIQTATTT
jgi:carbamate kinase